jgi:Putative beta-barrel porin 2
MRRLVLAAGILLASAPNSRAQEIPDPAAEARIHFGPLALTPTLALVNAGMDTNVFNEPTFAGPKRDFTITFEPKADWWLRMGPTWFLGNVTEGFVYYDKYADERSINGFYKGGWLVPLTRLTTQVDGSYLTTRDRPGFEIDERARRFETTVDGSVEVRALSRTFVGIKAKRQEIEYDAGATFQEESLRVQLNRTVTEGALTFRHELTPLTSLTVDVQREQARFKFAPLRDADSTQIIAGVQFDPYALLKGSATFGYRDFKPRVSGLPKYKGSTAAIDLTYLALVSTKIMVRGTRDVQYSYDINQPYYLQTGISGEVMQKILGPVDIVGRAGFATLDYRDREGVEVLVENRSDSVRLYGGGIGYRIGKDVRLGFNLDYQKRESQVPTRQYEGFRCGTSVTYGL